MNDKYEKHVKEIIEELVEEYGEQYRLLLEDAWFWVKTREPVWDLPSPLNHEEFLRDVVIRATM